MSGPYDYDDQEDYEFCPACSGMGTVACHCGGDLCVCENYGERDCGLCYGEGEAHKDRVAAYMKHQAEMAKALHDAMSKAK